ncbi:MAG: aspartate dehydrogenase domain-containing protein [Pseudomonadota bacterium]
MARIAIIGRGAIGKALAPLLQEDSHEVMLMGRGDALAHVLEWQPHFAVEAAGQDALAEHGIAILKAGVPLIAASVGALADDELRTALRGAAEEGQTRLHLPAGAIAGIDALAALPGPVQITYTGTKPSHAWPKGTSQGVFFEGSARQAAQQYPKNANVAATLALAVDGLDTTRVKLVSDSSATGNSHEWTATGGGSQIEVAVRNAPTAQNPGSSALTVHSLHRTIRNLTGPVAL